MDTKEKIISTSIELFNKEGVTNVTSRHIAKALSISNGNFCYHYPNKESLLIAIHEKMVEEISPYYAGILESQENAMVLFDRLIQFLDLFNQRYSFFGLDVLEISRNYAGIATRLKSTAKKRQDQIEAFFMQFQEEGFMVEGTYTTLKQVVYSLAVNWQFNQTVFGVHEELTMKRCIWRVIKPYLTVAGLTYYKENIKS